MTFSTTIALSSVLSVCLCLGCNPSHERDPSSELDPPPVLCPDSDLPVELPMGVPTLYVLEDASPGGNGSSVRPFQRVTDAVAAATPGTIVAIGRGKYDEEIALPDGITLWGVCVGETLLTSSGESDARAIIEVEGADTAIRNLSVDGLARTGIRATGVGHEVEIVDVHVTTRVGVASADGGRIQMERFWISGGVCGVYLGEGAEADLLDGTLTENTVALCLGCGAHDYDFDRLGATVFADNELNILHPTNTIATGRPAECE